MRLLCSGLWSRRYATLLTVLSIAVSFALLLAVEKIREQARSGFASTVAGADLLAGPRTGAVNLLLYAIFHRGGIANGMSWDSYQKIARRPEVAWTIPLSLGDSHRGFPVLGTTGAYFEHYRYGAKNPLVFAVGGAFHHPRDAVLGAEIAQRFGYRPGASIVIAHGMGAVSFSEHGQAPFTVTGVLARTGTPVDRTVHIQLDALTAIHAPHRATAGHTHADATEDDDGPAPAATISAVLLGLKHKSSVFSVQRMIDGYRGEALTAVIPGLALQELWQTVGAAETALLAVSACAVFAGLLGMMSAVLTALDGRRREMAILRSVGAAPLHIAALLLAEVLALVLAGALLALLLVNTALLLAGPALELRFGVTIGAVAPTLAEWKLLAALILTTTAMGLLPAWRAYRQTLADGLSPRL